MAAGLVAVVTVLSVVIGIVAGLRFAGGGTAVTADPSDKARILAEFISEAMNCAALAFVLLLPLGIVGMVLWARRRRRQAGADGSGPGTPT